MITEHFFLSMAAIFTIQLNRLRFFSTHGLYAEEAAAGNEFEVNLSLLVKAPEERITSLSETVNYAAVYRLVSELFSVRKALLETIAMEMADEKRSPTLKNETNTFNYNFFYDVVFIRYLVFYILFTFQDMG